MSSYTIDWDDIGEFATVGYVGAGFFPVALGFAGVEKLAEKKPGNPRHAWIMRPLVAAAKKCADMVDRMEKHDGYLTGAVIGCSIAGAAAGITAVCLAGPWLGASWAAIWTLKGFGLGMGALGIGAATAPVVAATLTFTSFVAVPFGIAIARGWQDVKSEIAAGRAETREWKKERDDEKRGIKKPHPLIAAAEARHVDLDTHGLQERSLLFNRLRQKFPEEFAEAVRRTDHDTVLRDKVKVCKQIKLKARPPEKKRSQSWAMRGPREKDVA